MQQQEGGENCNNNRLQVKWKSKQKRAKEPGGLREVKKFEPEFGAAAAAVAFLFAVY